MNNDHKYCCSWLNICNKDKRCNRITCKDSDFCKYHIRSKIYMSDNLKPKRIELPIENLLGIYDSWDEVPKEYHIQIDDKMWDLRIMANIFANQINSCEMEGPKPLYPHNPFNRKNFSVNGLMLFKLQCEKVGLYIYIGLHIFLDSIHNIQCDQEYMTSKNMSQQIANILSKTLRFQIKNYRNSQDCYTGLWVKKRTSKSKFETIYSEYNNEPFQIYDSYMGIIMDNPKKILMRMVMNSHPVEPFDVNDPKLCVSA